MEVNGLLHTLSALLPGKEPLMPLGWETGRAPEPVCTRWREVSAPADNRIPFLYHVLCHTAG
jgi:hypothetical protein